MAKILHLLFGIWLIVACFDGASCAGEVDPDATVTPTDDGSPETSPFSVETEITPGTLESISTPDVTSSTEPPQVENPCLANPCGSGSTCESRAGGFVCLCLTGDYYSYEGRSCNSAKVFPGTLGFPNVTYNNKMDNKLSEDFKNASEIVMKNINKTFNTDGNGYLNSTVSKISPLGGSRAREESSTGIEATVEILFETSSPINQSVINALATGFTAASLCDPIDPEATPCDISTSKCLPLDGNFNCICKDGYIPSKYSRRVCAACPGGSKSEGDQCIECDFGYTGFNCEDEWQLILVIVGSVLGGLLLLTLILLPVVARRSSKNKSKGEPGTSYVNSAFDKAPLVNNYNANAQAASRDGSLSAFTNNGAPRIPRATPVTRLDSLQMTPVANRRNEGLAGRNMVYDDEILPYSQSRSQSNNPYASSHGRGNPYSNDNSRRHF